MAAKSRLSSGKVSVLVADVIRGLGLQEALHSRGLVTAGLLGTPELAVLPGKTGEVWMETLEALPTHACSGSALYPTSRSLSGTVCPSWVWEWRLVHGKAAVHFIEMRCEQIFESQNKHLLCSAEGMGRQWLPFCCLFVLICRSRRT